MGDNLEIRTTAKDSVFTHLFTIPKYQLEMYKVLHPEDTDISESDLQTITRRCVVAEHQYNDLGILARNSLMILVEAQSSWSPNIVLRIMSYAVQSLMDYFQINDVFLYSNSKASCPRPELYVIYTGDRVNQPQTLSFREVFFPKDTFCDLDATVHFLYYQDDNKDIINQYIFFCKVFTQQCRLLGRTKQALIETFRICRDKQVLEDYLKQRETEVMDIMNALFDQDYVTQQYGREQARIARQDGIKEGINQGKIEGIKQGKIEGIKEGKIEGIKQGKIEGIKQGIINMAAALLNENMTFDFIHRVTGLSIEEIKDIQANCQS